ncbi:MAG: MarR family winged helix-turn-helix transcriptional regulator [Tannerella sp.]|jgi:DNA-binding MarR family transcriptional regulator|nr:MarR family winged helix-turn-helix transcriptional regulator [Tannerella sp.]
MEKQIKEPLCIIRDIYRLINDFESELQSGCGVGLNEGMLLCSLSKMEKCTSGQIAELLGLTSSNASKVIISAEKKRLIERIVGKEDKRQMLFMLTPEGKKCIKTIKCNPENIIQLIHKIKEI